jgi:hypothetical protein
MLVTGIPSISAGIVNSAGRSFVKPVMVISPSAFLYHIPLYKRLSASTAIGSGNAATVHESTKHAAQHKDSLLFFMIILLTTKSTSFQDTE